MKGLLNNLKSYLKVFGPFSIRLLIGMILGILSVVLFAKLSEDILHNETEKFDTYITTLVRFNITDQLTQVMRFISEMGAEIMVIIVGLSSMGYYFFLKKDMLNTIQIPVVIGGGAILNVILKNLFSRQRPELPHLDDVTGLSFPSGHSMVNFALYGLLIFLSWKSSSSRVSSILISLSLGLFVISIGISRIYLGVHYPSDVLAGYAAGSFWLVAVILGFRALRYHLKG